MGWRRSAERPHREAARGGGREARAALEAERSNDESAAEEPFPRASAAARSALPQRRAALLLRRGAGYAAKAFAAGTEPRGGSRVQTGALKLRSASEKRPVNAKPPSVCASRRKPAAFGAAAHRSQKIGGAKALLLIGGAKPERKERRGDTQTDAGTPFPERRDTAGGQTHPTAAHRKRLRTETAMRERGNSLHPLEHVSRGRPSLQALALAAERYTESRSRTAGEAFRGGGGYSRAASARRSLDKPRAGLLRRMSRIRFGCASACRFVPIGDCAAAGIGKPAAVPTHLSEAAI